MHYGFGKGTGGLIGGAIIAATHDVALAFRYFGVGAAIFGFIYFIYEYFYAHGFAYYYRDDLKKTKEKVATKKAEPLETLEPFLENGKESSIIKKK